MYLITLHYLRNIELKTIFVFFINTQLLYSDLKRFNMLHKVL